MASGRLIFDFEPALSDGGVPVSGATLTVYNAGTTTKASIFSDPGLSTGSANPQTSDSAGRFYAQTTVIWADASQAYDYKVEFPNGQIFTFSQIYTLGAQTNTSGFAPLNSPFFTGTPEVPTPALNDDSSLIANTAYVQGQGYAPLNAPDLVSPTMSDPVFTGTTVAPTVAPGTNDTQVATTAFVEAAVTAAQTQIAKAYVLGGSSPAFVKQSGFSGVSRPAGGTFLFTMSPAMPNEYYVLQATTSGASSQGVTEDSSFARSTTQFQVLTFNGGGSHDAVNMSITVTPLA